MSQVNNPKKRLRKSVLAIFFIIVLILFIGAIIRTFMPLFVRYVYSYSKLYLSKYYYEEALKLYYSDIHYFSREVPLLLTKKTKSKLQLFYETEKLVNKSLSLDEGNAKAWILFCYINTIKSVNCYPKLWKQKKITGNIHFSYIIGHQMFFDGCEDMALKYLKYSEKYDNRYFRQHGGDCIISTIYMYQYNQPKALKYSKQCFLSNKKMKELYLPFSREKIRKRIHLFEGDPDYLRKMKKIKTNDKTWVEKLKKCRKKCRKSAVY